MKFNEKLIDLRKKSGLSQEELGNKLNVTRQTISKWELGQTTPEIDKLTEISVLFNVSVDELLNTAETPTSNHVIKEGTPRLDKPKNKKAVFILIGLLLAVAIALSIVAIKTPSNKVDSSNSILGLLGNIFNTQMDIMESSNDFNKKFNTSSFNSKFQIYNGSTMGASAKKLLDEIVTSNKTNDKKITVIYNEITTQDAGQIQSLKADIDDFNNFEISYDYDDEGYITTANITRVITKQEIQRFNSSYQLYAGSNMGGSVISLLDRIITNNKTEERKISISYAGSETLDENEIRNIKNQIDIFDDFDVICEYDQEGFIYKMILNKLS